MSLQQLWRTRRPSISVRAVGGLSTSVCPVQSLLRVLMCSLIDHDQLELWKQQKSGGFQQSLFIRSSPRRLRDSLTSTNVRTEHWPENHSDAGDLSPHRHLFNSSCKKIRQRNVPLWHFLSMAHEVTLFVFGRKKKNKTNQNTTDAFSMFHDSTWWRDPTGGNDRLKPNLNSMFKYCQQICFLCIASRCSNTNALLLLVLGLH